MRPGLKAIRRRAHHWRARIADGGLTTRAQRQFERWIAADPAHGEAFAEAELVWAGLGEITYDPSLRSEALKARRQRGLSWDGALASVRGAIGRIGVAPFAVVVSLVLGWQVVGRAPLPSAPIVYQTAIGQRQIISLGDGSQITLDANSRLMLSITRESRAATLVSGAAFFDVAADAERPFRIDAGYADIAVVGTQFEVQRRADQVMVAVTRGLVQVVPSEANAGAGGATAIRLAAGESVSASDAGLGRVGRLGLADIGAWRSGRLIYVGARLAHMIEDANRYSARPIEVAPEVRDLRLSGTFNTNDIEGLVSALDAALPVRIEDDGRVRTIVAD